MSLFLFIRVLMLVVFCGAGSVQAQKTIVAHADSEEYGVLLHDQIIEPFKLSLLSYESDILFQQQEFLYLVGLKKGQIVTKDDLHKALSYLFKKRKFSSITLQLDETPDGTQVHFIFESMWTFQKLGIRGVWVDKDFYRRLYLIEPGEPFDEKKHELSLEKIREVCKSSGYLHCNVESRLERDDTTKSVNVSIGVHRGHRFKMAHVSLEIISPDYDPEEVDILRIKGEKKYIHLLQGGVYNTLKITKQMQELKRYLSQEGFLQAAIRFEESIDLKNRHINIKVIVDLGQKKDFIFAGNHFLSAPQLLDVILEFGKSAWLLPASILSQELVRAYYAQGYWDVHIDAQEEHERYFFLINEGERASISGVQLKNVVKVDPAPLIKKIFTEMLKKKYFDESAYKKALDKLIEWYVDRGYLDAKILKKSFEKGYKNAHELIITLDEGEQCVIDVVTIAGYESWLNEGPFARLKHQKSVPFDSALIAEQRAWLMQRAQSAGLSQPFIKLGVQRDGARMTLNWKVKEATKTASFGKTVVIGSTTFPFEYLMRELQHEQGQEWEQNKIKQSLIRLKALDVFDRIHVYPAPGGLIDEERPVILQLHKDDPFELRLRGGITAQQIAREFEYAGMTYKAGGTFLFKNPGNIGDHLGIDGDFTKGFHKLAAFYQVPWLGNWPVASVFKGYNNKYYQPGFIGSTRNIYEVTQRGFLTGLSYDAGKFSQELNIGLEWMETDINRSDPQVPFLERSIARAINFQSNLVDKNIPYFLVEPTLYFNQLDSKLDPHCGYSTLFSAKGMFPINHKYWDSYFVKAMLEQSVFVPVGPLVAAMRVRLGHIFHQDFRAIMPIERFYLGGANSLRGYDTDLAPPLGSFVDEKDRVQYVPQGGKSMFNANFEVRCPVYKGLGAVLFQDIGALSAGAFSDFKESTILACTGVGVRYATPIGPLRLDVGWKWRPDPTETRYAWFLTFGHAF